MGGGGQFLAGAKRCLVFEAGSFCLVSPNGHTAVRVNGLASDVARFFRGQEGDRVADVFGRLLALQRGIVVDKLYKL